MGTDDIRFETRRGCVTVHGYPALEGVKGIASRDEMAFFFGDNNDLYIANRATKKIRQFSSGRYLLVDDKDIDYDAIERACMNGLCNARAKAMPYAPLNRWRDFENRMCAISWTLYPDGLYFADEDGFGMENNNEEIVYAVIDTDLDIIAPFRPVQDVAAYLKMLRKAKRGSKGKGCW